MEKETLKRIFEFLKEKEGLNAPFIWKLKNNEPFTEESVTINSDLDLSRIEITLWPKRLKVVGNLILANSKMKSLPDNLEVTGYLDLSRSEITSLPSTLKVGGDLRLRNCKSIKILPKGLEVEGNLFVYGSNLDHYSDDSLYEMVKPGFIIGEIF